MRAVGIRVAGPLSKRRRAGPLRRTVNAMPNALCHAGIDNRGGRGSSARAHCLGGCRDRRRCSTALAICDTMYNQILGADNKIGEGWFAGPFPPPLPSNEASPSARHGRRKRNVSKALSARPLRFAAQELRGKFSEWPFSLPTCGLAQQRYRN